MWPANLPLVDRSGHLAFDVDYEVLVRPRYERRKLGDEVQRLANANLADAR
jgi:hypothetical protein